MIILRFILCIIFIINQVLFSIGLKFNNEEKDLKEFDYEYQIVRAKRDTISYKAKKGSKTTERPEKEKKKKTENKKEKNKKKKDKKKKDKKKKDKKKKNKKKKRTKSTKITTSTLSTTAPLITTTTKKTSSVTSTSTTTKVPPKTIHPIIPKINEFFAGLRTYFG
uniref:Uncharacterized protein n=1 Tax=Strongyloides venezuelensis TaxID=75913 RepID=A0A0K0FU78_STRVS